MVGLQSLALALAGMLADSVANHRGAIYKGALPHVLQPAGARLGFPPSSSGDCSEGDKAIGPLPN